MIGRYKYRKKYTIDQILLRHLLSDFFSHKESKTFNEIEQTPLTLGFKYDKVGTMIYNIYKAIDGTEQQVLLDYFGEANMTYKDIAKKYNISKYHATKIVRKAMERFSMLINMY